MPIKGLPGGRAGNVEDGVAEEEGILPAGEDGGHRDASGDTLEPDASGTSHCTEPLQLDQEVPPEMAECALYHLSPARPTVSTLNQLRMLIPL